MYKIDRGVRQGASTKRRREDENSKPAKRRCRPLGPADKKAIVKVNFVSSIRRPGSALAAVIASPESVAAASSAKNEDEIPDAADLELASIMETMSIDGSRTPTPIRSETSCDIFRSEVMDDDGAGAAHEESEEELPRFRAI